MSAIALPLREWETKGPGSGSPTTGLSLDGDARSQRVAKELTSSKKLEVLELAEGLEFRASSCAPCHFQKLKTQTRNGFQKVFKSLPALTTRVEHRPRTLLFLPEAQAYACGRVSNLTFRKSILLTAGLGVLICPMFCIIMTNFSQNTVLKE